MFPGNVITIPLIIISMLIAIITIIIIIITTMLIVMAVAVIWTGQSSSKAAGAINNRGQPYSPLQSSSSSSTTVWQFDFISKKPIQQMAGKKNWPEKVTQLWAQNVLLLLNAFVIADLILEFWSWSLVFVLDPDFDFDFFLDSWSQFCSSSSTWVLQSKAMVISSTRRGTNSGAKVFEI